MTMYTPNLRVDQLIVMARGRQVFNEAFHPGLNIIRGENSSGKSTVMDFIFYGLGGDLTSWRESALQCESVLLAAQFNGKPAVLARDVDSQSSRPMKIFIGTIEEALKSASDGWEIYPYARGSKDSFSQVLFRFLGLPEVQYGETETKITINQVLRLLYADQLSPVERLFRFVRFDDAITRQTVGDLLCGAFSSQYYNARLRLVAAGKEFDAIETRIDAVLRTYAREAVPLTKEWLDAETARYSTELEETNEEIKRLEEEIFNAQFDDRVTLNDQKETYNRLVSFQEEIARSREQIDEITLEIADSDRFIGALNEKMRHLQHAGIVLSDIGVVEYEVCPSCLTKINSVEDGVCSLCHSPFTAEDVKARSLKQVNEIAQQLKESTELQAARQSDLTKLKERMVTQVSLWEQAGRHYAVAVRSPTTETRLRLRSLNRNVGYITKKLEELASRAEIVAQLNDLRSQKESLNTEISLLKSTIYVENLRNLDRVASARQKIERIVIDFLKSDLARQSTFEKAERVTFEFDADRIAVNDDSFFSASSMVYLKNSFLAALLFAAANDHRFNHPRFLLMDTVEDKGMEPERSKNFQRLLAEYSSNAESEHQVIIATSMIDESLNNPTITVGDFYTHNNRTLKFSGN